MNTAKDNSHTPRPCHRAGFRRMLSALLVGSALILPRTLFAQNQYVQHNLVSDLPGVADRTDTNLVNPWGIATSGTSPFWVSDNHSGLSTLYNSTGAVLALVVHVPAPGSGDTPGAPTGIIFNGDSKSFLIGTNGAARFIFATEDGTIAAWSSGTNAVLKVDNSASGAIYKGLALASDNGTNYLYAADFHNGRIDVFDSSFQPVAVSGGFADASVPAGYAPFNIQNLSGQLYVTYAQQDADREDDVSGDGHGIVNVFDASGHMVKRFAANGALNSPWGLAMAPGGFGQFSTALLIGNFGDGRINAFDPTTGTLLGSLNGTNGAPLSISGLWGLKFGNGGQGGALRTLYFSAGIPGQGSVEDHGLFGSISVGSSIQLTVAPGDGETASLQWSGGAAPYLVQRKLQLFHTNWFDVLTTSNLTATVPRNGSGAFFRVIDHAPTSVTPFTIVMTSAAEVPNVTAQASGFGIVSLQGNMLEYQVEFSGLTGPAQAAHIHGPADTTQPATVIIPLEFSKAAAGMLSGTLDLSQLTPDQLAALRTGRTYINVHTAANPGGELRGQVAPVSFTALLTGAAEVPPVSSSGTASAVLTLVGQQLFWDMNYSGLSSDAIASHIHGPASTTQPAGVLFGIGNPTGTSGRLTGSQTLTMQQRDDLLNGLTYINIHTKTNQGGEIRGQILLQ